MQYEDTEHGHGPASMRARQLVDRGQSHAHRRRVRHDHVIEASVCPNLIAQAHCDERGVRTSTIVDHAAGKSGEQKQKSELTHEETLELKHIVSA